MAEQVTITNASAEELQQQIATLQRQLEERTDSLAQAQAALGWLNLRFNTLQQLMHLFNEDLSLAEALDQALEVILSVSECEAGSIFLLDEEKDELYFAAVRGPSAEQLKKVRLKRGEGIVGWAIEENETVAVSDVYRDARFKREISESVGLEVNSVLCAPIRVRGVPIGAIEVLNKPHQEPFVADDSDLLNTAAHAVGLLIENLRLRGVGEE
ncbi:MAG TPA: GAF domain-containing protein [Armatimonadetes bacterium]|nr:GAF domain-containing protein [Armatimonadota bacterium]